MHVFKTGRVGLLAAIAAVVAIVAVLPMFGGTAYAAGVNLNNSAAFSRFIIPGTPVTRSALALDAVTQPPFNLKVNSTTGFPQTGQLLVSDGAWGDGDKNGAEIMTYSAIKGKIGPASITNAIEIPASEKFKFKLCNPATFKVVVENVTFKAAPPVQGQVVYWNEDPTDDVPAQPAGCPTQQGFYEVVFAGGGSLGMVKLIDPPCKNIISNAPAKDDRVYEVHCGFTITERGPAKLPGTVKKAHPVGSKVKLATVTQAAILATDGPQGRMVDANVAMAGNQDMTATQGGCTAVPGETFALRAAIAPFMILLQAGEAATFPASGNITISHQDVQTANQSGVGPGQASEFLAYDKVGAVGDQIRITDRGLQTDNRCYPHKATGYLQPGQNVKPTPLGGQAGVTKVSVHFQLNVKDARTASPGLGFFPAGSLLVCNATNPLTNCELIGHNNRTKIKTPVEDGAGGAQDQFHMTSRCADASTHNKFPNTGGDGKTCSFPVHPIGSIVTGADGFLFCRNGNLEPGVDTDLGTGGFQEPAAQVPGTSVGVNAVCYTTSQPKDGPSKSPTWPIIVGQDLIVIASIAGQPFLSTGGFTHVVLGPVPHVDDNGPTDGILSQVSPCIIDFSPGTNLQVNVTLATDKTLLGTDTGTIRVVLDTVHDDDDPVTPADNCDDPSGTDLISSTVYDSATGEPVVEKDDDTDRDGCVDEKELRSILNQGGLRDPWNPYDWYDINHDGAVTAGVDVLQVAQAFGVPANYSPRKDRGAVNFGPFAWNKSGPNNNINSGGDVLGVSQQFSSPCLHDSNTMTPTHEGYDTGAAWPAGNRPWYCNTVTFLCGSGVPPHGVANHGP